MAGFDPLYTGIGEGVKNAVSNITGAIVYRNKKGEARDVFNRLIKSIDADLNPPPETVYQDPETGQQIPRSQIDLNDPNMPVQGQQSPEPDMNKAFMNLYKGLGELDPYADISPELGKYAASYFENNMPKYETIKVKNTVGRLNTKTNKFTKLYEEEPEVKAPKNIGTAYSMKLDDNTYKLAIDVWDDETQTYKTEYIRDLTKEEAADLDRKNSSEDATLSNKLRGPRGPRAPKGPKIPETSSGQEALLKADIDAYAILKRMDWEQMDEKQQAQYKQLNERIARTTGQDPDELTNYVYSQEFTSKNKTDQYGDVINERKADIQSQYDFVDKEYNNLMAKLNAGQIDPESAKKYALDLYNANINIWYPEVKNWLLEYLNSFGISIK